MSRRLYLNNGRPRPLSARASHRPRIWGERPQRTGALLVCVLVVLLIVGMLTIQTTQTMIIIRRGDRQRAHLQQARELVELARLVIDETDIREPAVWRVALPSGVGEIEIIPRRVDDSPGYRVLARYPADVEQPIQVSWDSAPNWSKP